jgi:hypothetical protein
MAFEKSVLDVTFKAENAFTSSQYLCVEISGAMQVDVCDTAGEKCIGILQNTPAASGDAVVRLLGVSKAVAGAAITRGDFVGTTAAGKVQKHDDSTEYILGYALETASATSEVIAVMITGPQLVS